MSDWKTQLRATLDAWKKNSTQLGNESVFNLIISPDIDGITSAIILNSFVRSKIIGTYRTKDLDLFDDYTVNDAKSALWLDEDINHSQIISIGQHVIHHQIENTLPTRNPFSWNPNAWAGQSWAESFRGQRGGRKHRDKFPFGTCHLVWDLLKGENDLNEQQRSVLAHADGTWFALHLYPNNAHIWQDLMFQTSNWASGLITYTDLLDANPAQLEAHQNLVRSLREIGFTGVSNSPAARDLNDVRRGLTGCQSTRRRLQGGVIESLNGAIALVSQYLDLPALPTVRSITDQVQGRLVRSYPNQIDNFDAMLVNEDIFSHAFTAFSELSYTKGFNI